MLQKIHRWLVAVALTGLTLFASGTQAIAQIPVAPAPRPLPDPAPASTPDRPPAYVLPPVTEPVPAFPRPDPLLDRPEMPAPGPFVNVDLNILQVHLRNQLTNTVSVNPDRTDTIRFEGNPLDWTVSPRFEIGYRLMDGFGDLKLGYRFLTTTGAQTILTDQGLAKQHGRLNFNEFDFTYVSREFSLGPLWDMRWNAGVRGATLYFDSRLDFANSADVPGNTLMQSESNFFHGYGVLAGLELTRKTGMPGLEFFARVEQTALWGRIKQNFREQAAGPTADQPQSGISRFQTSLGVEMLTGMVGLSYTLPQWNQSRFLIGYEYESWFNIGRFGDSRAQLDMQGIILRMEINY